MNKKSAKTSQAAHDALHEALTDAADRMEPELYHLRGIVVALRIMGEARDSVEPVALSSLARSGGDALEIIEDAWESARLLARKHQT